MIMSLVFIPLTMTLNRQMPGQLTKTIKQQVVCVSQRSVLGSSLITTAVSSGPMTCELLSVVPKAKEEQRGGGWEKTLIAVKM